MVAMMVTIFFVALICIGPRVGGKYVFRRLWDAFCRSLDALDLLKTFVVSG
jgi:hypothetical protein